MRLRVGNVGSVISCFVFIEPSKRDEAVEWAREVVPEIPKVEEEGAKDE
jgi:hypothetical protein